MNSAFFESYKRNVNDAFMLYKNHRDMYDTVNNEQHDNYDKLNQKIINTSFGLYRLFVLHTNGASYDELKDMTNNNKLKYSFRRIREFVRQRYN